MVKIKNKIQKVLSNNRIGPVLFLTLMLLFATLLTAGFDKREELVATNQDIRDNFISNEISQNFVQPIERDSIEPAQLEEIPIAQDEEVLAVNSGSGGGVFVDGIQVDNPDASLFSPTQGCQAQKLYFTPQLSCNKASADYDIRDVGTPGGDLRVRGNVEIELVEVTYPGGLLAGLNAYKRDENAKEKYVRNDISPNFPTFTAAGSYCGMMRVGGSDWNGAIDEHEEFRRCFATYDPAPAASIMKNATFASDTLDAVDKSGVDYLSDYCVSTDSGNCDNPLEVKQYGEIQKGTSSNPGASGVGGPNAQTNHLMGLYQGPGLIEKDSREKTTDAVACADYDVNSIAYADSQVFKGCINNLSATNFAVNLLLNAQQAAECFGQEQGSGGDCDERLLVGILVTPPFGSNDTCIEGRCAMKFFSQTESVWRIPGDEKAQTVQEAKGGTEAYTIPDYLRTNCKIRINSGAVKDIPCIHDISYIKAQFYDIMNNKAIPCAEGDTYSFCSMDYEDYKEKMLEFVRENSKPAS